MSAVARIEAGGAVAAMDEKQLMEILKNSLYPGASDDSIKLVLGYCQASKLDPMQKPVHIVPMYVATGKKDGQGYDVKAMRDVIMPGIGLYRTQASRTNSYAGISQPEYGEEVTETMDGVEVTYPKWCSITVEKIVGGEVRRFSAKEFWLENYATKSNKSNAPNQMWKRRPYAQIAKCAEAQALRKAFPDTVGAAPTAEEMEGKEYETIDHATGEITTGKPKVSLPQPKNDSTEMQRAAAANVPNEQPTNEAPEKPAQQASSGTLMATDGEKKFILNKITAGGLDKDAVLEEAGISSLDNLTRDGFTVLKELLKSLER